MLKHFLTVSLLITSTINGSNCLAGPNKLLVGTLHFKEQNLDLKVEIAANEEQRQTGLMFRPTLATDHGMLFVFEESAIIHIWMKNTQMPLDVVFIDQTGKIVSLLKNLPPCKQTNCPIYPSDAPASFMLELNAGFIEQQHIRTGQQLTLPF
jgi:uncharacterized membrane protein (UPF0127 family)